MRFLKYEVDAGLQDIVEVTLSAQANVLLLDSTNYHSYRRGGRFHYQGGWATSSPMRLAPPHEGHWYVVVDRGGRAGRVSAGVRVLSAGRA